MALFKRASPYADDVMNLPVRDVATALPFYETVMGFRVDERDEQPHARAALSRDDIRIGLAENGGDPEQEGAFIEVDDVEGAWAQLRANGLQQDAPSYRVDQHGDTAYRVFFVIAPDGLCYCIGERQG